MVEKSSSRINLEEKIDPDDDGNRKAVREWYATWTPKLFLAFQEPVKELEAQEDL
jgi:hypothetical protein